MQVISRMLPERRSYNRTPLVRRSATGALACRRDGSVWFAEGTGYGFTRLKDGVVEAAMSRKRHAAALTECVDAQGNVWGTLQSGNQIVRISSGGRKCRNMKYRPVAPRPATSRLIGAGKAWFLEFRRNKIGKFADGKFTEFEVPGKWAGLTGLTAAPDGSVWFGLLRGNSIGRMRDGEIKLFPLPRVDARPYTLAADKKGNIWYADISGHVGMLTAEAAKR